MSDPDAKDREDGGEEKPAETSKYAPREMAHGGANDIIDFAGKIDLHAGQALPQHNVGPNKAYRAYTKDRARTALVALVCERYLIPRLNSADVYKSVVNPCKADLVDFGKVFWPLAGHEKFVLFYLDNFGDPILKKGERPALGWKQEEVMNIIVKPIIGLFQDFRDKDFVHGAIRPDNMFDMGAGKKLEKVMLGDCLSGPFSYTQPALYESIPRALTDPVARGRGTRADDLYSFGVSLAVIMRQNDPLKGMSYNDVIQEKITFGSYAAVTGKDRFKGEILELLRGLLHDDPTQRWSLEEVLVWMDGRRLSPKQATTHRKAPRPITFGEEKFFTVPLLAMALRSDPAETKSIVEDDSLIQWLERSLDNEELSEKVQAAIAVSNDGGVASQERLVSNVSVALDPSAPLYYKGLSVMGDGVGPAMAEAIITKQNIAPYAEMFSNSIIFNWLNAQEAMSIDVTALFSRFEQCRRVIKSKRMGEGLERCLYILCPECFCFSEIVKDYYVTTPDELLKAFEDLCQKKKAPPIFLDRHIVAFLYERDFKMIEPYIYDLNMQDPHKVVLANLKCMAAIQRRYELGKLPGVSQAFEKMLPLVYNRYHDRGVREKLAKGVADYAANGELSKMASLLDNVEVIQKDYSGYRRAMEEYAQLEAERLKLEVDLFNKDTFGLASGREVSAMVACVLSAVIIVGLTIMYLSKDAIF